MTQILSGRLPSMNDVIAGLDPRKTSEPAGALPTAPVFSPGPPPGAEEAAGLSPAVGVLAPQAPAPERGDPYFIRLARAE